MVSAFDSSIYSETAVKDLHPVYAYYSSPALLYGSNSIPLHLVFLHAQLLT